MDTIDYATGEVISGDVTINHPTGFIDMTSDEYHSSPGISKSHLDSIAEKSPLHYWHKYLNPEREPDQPTAAMQKGSAIHLAILEPHLVEKNMVCGLNVDRRSNENKASWANFEAIHAGKIILKADDYDHVMKMRDAIHSHPVAAGMFTGGKSEQSVFSRDIETNALIKCRYDYMFGAAAAVVDLKKTTDASEEGFGKSATDFRYDVQSAWYNHVTYCETGRYIDDWVFVAIEETAPYAIGVYTVAFDNMLRDAMATAMANFNQILMHKADGYWPDYGINPTQLKLRPWAKRKRAG